MRCATTARSWSACATTRPLPTFISGVVLDQLQEPVANIEVRLEELNRSVRTNRDGAFNFGFGDTAEQAIPGGQYRLLLNPGSGNRGYGADSRSVTVQGGERNDFGQMQLAQLSTTLPYVPVKGGSQLSLLEGEFKLDLGGARLVFPDGRQEGDLHAQMLQFSELPYPVEPLAMPYWMYALQPAGVSVQGTLSVDLAALRLGNTLDYLPPDGSCVVMVGLDRQAARIVPVGVGVIGNGRIRSQGCWPRTTSISSASPWRASKRSPRSRPMPTANSTCASCRPNSIANKGR